MKKRKKIGNIIMIFIMFIIVLWFIANRLLNNSLPDYNKTFALAGLTEKVEVYRDSFAIPHIFAQNEEDLYRVVGYLTAQDRLWQMDLMRRVTLGRLAETFGPEYIKTDKLMRALRIPEKSKQVIATSSKSVIKNLEAYTDGINQFIKSNKRNLPVEFFILGYKPDIWKIEHSVNLIGYMAWDLNGSWNAEIILHKLCTKLNKQQITDLIPVYDTTQSVIFKQGPQGWGTELMSASAKIEALGLEVFHGSNNWVVSGSKTVSGKPILANDMHLGYSVPGVWYPIHQVVTGKINVTGVMLPGQPYVVSGHNDSIAWGLTNVMNDDIDFYRETLNPRNPNQYKLDGNWKDLVVKHETIAVKGGDTVRFDLKFTHRGPIISNLKKLGEEVVSMRWMGNEPSNELQSICSLNTAKNYWDFCSAMKTFLAISQNVAFADNKGNIAMYCCAGVPLRKGNPIFVMPGDTTAYDWKGIVPFEQLPHQFNPTEGFAVSANNRTTDSLYPYYISNWYDLPFRYDRISEMLNQKAKLTLNDMVAAQTDFTSKQVAYYLPTLISILDAQKNLSETGKQVLHLLKEWGGTMEASNAAPLVYEIFYNQFLKNTLHDEMGDELFKEFLTDKIVVRNTFHNIWQKKSSVLCDDIATATSTESFDDMVRKSFDEALQEIGENQGKSLAKWEWGKTHTFTLQHPLGKVKALDWLLNLNRGPFPVGGAPHTVAPFSYRLSTPYKVMSGASQRHIYDLANWDNSLSVIPTGISGQPNSNHYCDQTGLYLTGNYHRDLFSEKLAKQYARYKTVFLPVKAAK